MPCCRQQQEAKGLLFFYVHNEVLTTYLIISCNELRHCMKNVLSCELAGTCHFLEVQLLLTLLFRVTASLLLVFFFLHCVPTRSRNRPMVYWYVFCLTPLFVDLKMLSNMKTARRIPSDMKSLLYSILFNKLFIIPDPN